jgi:uncharacterized membrane protein
MTHYWALALALHQLGTIVWIGGMFFAHMALRPAAAERLEPPSRLPLMLQVFDRFFPWVWASIILLWASGLWIYFGIYGGAVLLSVHWMMGIALMMTGLFVFIWLVPYRRMRAAVSAADWPAAGAQLAVIRRVIMTNLMLGLAAALLGASGGRF